MKSRSIDTIVPMLFTLAALAAAPVAGAAAIVVDSLGDVTANDGACTLREALVNANGDNQGGSTDCVAGAGADSITFAVNGIVTLAGSELPTVTGVIAITGNGADNTIIQASANNPVTNLPAAASHEYRVLSVASGGNLTLDGVTVRHGRCTGPCMPNGAAGGAGIFNAGSLTLRNSTVSGNATPGLGGGIRNDPGSTSTYENVVVSGNDANLGGGMFNNQNGATLLTDVTFTGNHADYGGGAYEYHTLVTYSGVAFHSNMALYGAGMAHEYASPTLVNATFSHNSATGPGGGIHVLGGAPTLLNVTFSGNASGGNGGGIYNFLGTPRLTNVIIANSSGGGDCFNDTGTVLDPASSHNLIEDTANACGLSNGVDGNVVGVDPKLGGLANNGGSTLTHSLPVDSPAVNAGAPIGCPAKDQRGVTRPQLGTCDIGAYEYQAPLPPAVTGVTLPGAVPLREGQQATSAITQLVIAFDQDMVHDGGADAANNPANYRLLRAEGNGFQTASCAGGVAAGDSAVTIDGVAYANNGGSGPFEATLNVNGGAALPVGTYMLLACGTTSIRNFNGDRLNGGVLDHDLVFRVVEAVVPPGPIRALGVSVEGPGSVGAAASPAPVFGAIAACPGGGCAAGYADGALVTLAATAATGGSFIGWGGACSGGGATCNVTMDAAKTVTARFAGPPGVSGIVIDPATPSTVYGALDGAGVYRSSDGGATWVAAATQPANPYVKALVIKPGDGATLFAATYGGGVFRSGNGGVDWAACAGQPGDLNLLSLAMAGGRLYAGGEAGVFVSSDDCASWTAMNNGLPN